MQFGENRVLYTYKHSKYNYGDQKDNFYLFSNTMLGQQQRGILYREVSFIERCPLFRVSLKRELTVYISS